MIPHQTVSIAFPAGLNSDFPEILKEFLSIIHIDEDILAIVTTGIYMI